MQMTVTVSERYSIGEANEIALPESAVNQAERTDSNG
jgi:hypothetical protein